MADQAMVAIKGEFAANGAYPDVNNPQFVLTLPEGMHNINVKCDREDLNRSDALIVCTYKMPEDGTRWYRSPPEDCIIDKSSYKKQYRAITMIYNIPGGKYIIMPATDNASSSGPFKLSVLTDGAKPVLDALDTQAAHLESFWGDGKCGGYCKADNPQFLLRVPAGEHQLFIQVERTDGAKDMGLVYWIFNYDGDGESRLAAISKGAAVASSSFMAASKVSKKIGLSEGSYVIIPTLQKIAAAGPLCLTVKADSFAPELAELGGDAVGAPPPSAPAAVASPPPPDAVVVEAPPEVKEFEATIDGSWVRERAAGYKKPDNPQVMMSLPHGEHALKFKLTRKGGEHDQGMVLFVYKYSGTGARMDRPATADIVAQTPYRVSSCIETEDPVVLPGGPNRYMLLACLKTPGAEGKHIISVEGDSAKPKLRILGGKSREKSVSYSGLWTEELSAGYMQLGNPQFLLELPQGEQSCEISVKRTDLKHSEGLSCLVYKHDGSEGPVDGDDAFKALKLVAKAPLKQSDKISFTAKLDGYPATYLVLPCLQNKGTTGPFSLSVESEDCIPMLTDLRNPDAGGILAELAADIDRIKDSKPTPKKLVKVVM